ncbi:MAG: hypothetical protein RIR11_1456 [Bacteroidota bacterium]|jgi:transmembrane sensor
MKEIYQDIDATIAKYFAGELAPSEIAVLEEWLAQSADNQHYFNQLQRIWEMAPASNQKYKDTFDTENALQKIKMQMAFKQQKPNTSKYWLSAAAAVAILAVAIWVMRPAPLLAPQEIVATPATILVDTLSDGSVVTLNRNSGLSIARGFNHKERRMSLHGEAYFEVSPDQERPFVVDIKELEVKVVGTAFNVDNVSEPDKVLISVTHGKVLVSAGTQSMYLTADEKALYDEQTKVLTRIPNQQNPNILAYKNKIFQFDATPLKEVVQQLSKVYGIQIALQSTALETCPLTARYNNLAIGRVLDLVANSFALKLEQKPDGSYLLSGSGCGE